MKNYHTKGNRTTAVFLLNILNIDLARARSEALVNILKYTKNKIV